MKLENIIKEFIAKEKLIVYGETILIGVSGGPDSIFLLHILNNLKYELGFNLHIVHYNHNLRNFSNKDQKFVQDVSKKLNIPFSTQTATLKSLPTKGSIEQWAREKRYKFFLKTAKKLKINKIALGHTQNDLAETVLMRILRGSGLQGIQAIRPTRLIEGLNVIRPLLSIRKNEILKYLEVNKIKFQEDPTNNSIKFTRNNVRHKLIPYIEQHYNQNILEILSNFSNNLSNDFSFIKAYSNKVFKQIAKTSENKIILDKEKFTTLHVSIQNMIIRTSIEQLKGNTNKITFTHLLEIKDLVTNKPNNTIINLPQSIKIRVTYKAIFVYK